MRLTARTALSVPAALALALAGAASASADESFALSLTDTMGNGSGSAATAKVDLDGDRMTVTIAGSGFTPNQPHAQHFHGSFDEDKDFVCPAPGADVDQDGQVTTEEGLPAYGDVIISLTTTGDTSPGSGLAVDRFPAADGQGNLAYRRTIDLPAGAGAKLRNLHIVQHGLDANGNGEYDLESLGESTFAASLGVAGLPEEATNPATCGTVSGAAAVGAPPAGGVQTGTRSGGDTASLTALGLAGLALAGAGGVLVHRRRLPSDG